MSAHQGKRQDSFTRFSTSPHDLFFISNGIRKRKIYYNVDYTETQEKWIRTVRKALKEQKGINIEEDQTILRYYYSADLDLEKCLDRLSKHHEWFKNPDIQNVTNSAKQIFKDGFTYSYGKAIDGRPFIIMNLGVFDLDKHNVNQYFQVLNNVLNRVVRQEFVPGSIENYYFVLDLDEKLLSLPLSSLGDIIKVIANAYSMHLQKMLIINSTTLSKWIYNRLTGFISQETAKKITLYTKDDVMEGQLKEFIDEGVLERKYGGKRQNIDHVRTAKDSEKQRHFHDNLSESETEYYSIEQNQDYFKEGSSLCCTNEQCQIY